MNWLKLFWILMGVSQKVNSLPSGVDPITNILKKMKKNEKSSLKIVVDNDCLFEFELATPVKNNKDVMFVLKAITELLKSDIDNGYEKKFEYNVK